jgi:hypothetical protein
MSICTELLQRPPLLRRGNTQSVLVEDLSAWGGIVVSGRWQAYENRPILLHDPANLAMVDVPGTARCGRISTTESINERTT